MNKIKFALIQRNFFRSFTNGQGIRENFILHLYLWETSHHPHLGRLLLKAMQGFSLK